MSLSVSFFYIAVWILNAELNIISASIPLLIAVISVSDTIHVIESFDKDRTNTYSNLGYALFYTSLTTATSFAVFLFAGNKVISSFAILTILGIALTYLIARYFAQHLFFLLEGSKRSDSGWLLKSKLFSNTYRIAFSIAFIVLTFAMLYPAQGLKADHLLHKHLVGTNEVTQANEFYFDHFDDERKLEIFIVSETDLFGVQNIKRLEKLETYLFDDYGADHVESPLLAIRRYNRARLGGEYEYYSLPENLDTTYLNRILKYRGVLGLKSTLSKDQKIARFVAGSKDLGSADALKKNQTLEQYLSRELPEGMSYLVGGPTSIQDKASIKITNTIYQGILIALLLLFVMISMIYRSIIIGIAGFLVNLFPLLIVTTMMWLMNIDLEPGSVMALSIILGIAVDDSIHFLSRLKLTLRNGADLDSAISITLLEIKRPVTITTLLLICGFAMFYFSSIESNHQNSLYFVAGLSAALLSDILFLPILISTFRINKSK
jgi:predicted RND superfamily exporter protein